ncbi:MAG: 30S ribosomal protein S9 [Candidatus Omnitrophica bacterium]|nr:30S ribosomal protein S9 [Candidatus Omnitrophota bacterium]
MADSGSVMGATGRRKNAIARVRLANGTGAVSVNKRPFEDYFKTETLRTIIMQPFLITKTNGKYDVKVIVSGGGIAGQAGAVRLGISRALAAIDETLKKLLRTYGFLTRDPRAKERKKYGQKRARKRFQYTKR